MMHKLLEEVKELIEREYGRASAIHGLTHTSDHQSYAVLLEEFEEAKEEVNLCQSCIEKFWELVKSDSPDYQKMNDLRLVYSKALFGACELIQVAAMAKKASITICDRGAIEEFKGE